MKEEAMEEWRARLMTAAGVVEHCCLADRRPTLWAPDGWELSAQLERALYEGLGVVEGPMPLPADIEVMTRIAKDPHHLRECIAVVCRFDGLTLEAPVAYYPEGEGDREWKEAEIARRRVIVKWRIDVDADAAKVSAHAVPMLTFCGSQERRACVYAAENRQEKEWAALTARLGLVEQQVQFDVEEVVPASVAAFLEKELGAILGVTVYIYAHGYDCEAKPTLGLRGERQQARGRLASEWPSMAARAAEMW